MPLSPTCLTVSLWVLRARVPVRQRLLPIDLLASQRGGGYTANVITVSSDCALDQARQQGLSATAFVGRY